MGCGPQIKLQQYDLIDSSEEEEDTNRLAKHVVLTTVNKGDRLNYVRIKIANVLIQYGGIAVLKHTHRREELVCIMEYTKESLTFYTTSQKIGKTLTIKILPFQEPLFLTKKFDVFITYEHNALLLLQQIAVYNLDVQTNYFVVCTDHENRIPELDYMRMNLPNLIILNLKDYEASYFLNVLLKFNKEIAVVTAICPLWVLSNLFLVVKQQLLTFNFLATDCNAERFITEFKLFEQLILANAENALPPPNYITPEKKYFNFQKFNVYNPENKTVKSFKFRFASESVSLPDIKEELLKEQIVPFNQQEIANQGLFITTQPQPLIVSKHIKKSFHFKFNSQDLDLGLFAMMDPNYKDQSMSFLVTPHSNQQQNGDEENTDQSERKVTNNHAVRNAQNKFLIPKKNKPPTFNQPNNKCQIIHNNSQSGSEESVQFAEFDVEKSRSLTFELSEDKLKLKYAVSPVLEMPHINQNSQVGAKAKDDNGQQITQISERVEFNSGAQITTINLEQGDQHSFQVGQEQQLDNILNQPNANMPLSKRQPSIQKNFEQDMISQHDETPALLLQSNYVSEQVVNNTSPNELSYKELLPIYLNLRIKHDNGTVTKQELLTAQSYRTIIQSYEQSNVIQAFCEQQNIFESLRDKKQNGTIQQNEIKIAVYIKDTMIKNENLFVLALITEYQQNKVQLPSLQLLQNQEDITTQHIVRFRVLLKQYFEKLRTKRQNNTLSLIEMDQARIIKQMLDSVIIDTTNNDIEKMKVRFQELRLKKQNGQITGEEMNEACAIRKMLDNHRNHL